MKHLDRGSQWTLLNQLAERYPEPADHFFDQTDLHHPDSVNLHYLEGHGLVELGRSDHFNIVRTFGERRFNGSKPNGSVRITEAGMDFIQGDGGLTAILSVVTIRFHSETLSALEGKILASNDIPENEKTRLLDRLRSLPEEGAKTLTQEIVKAGLNRAPEVWETALRILSS